MNTILVGLNELNFEFIEHYIKQGHLSNFKALFHRHGYSKTHSEDSYHLLEPWIQWVTIYTGKTFKEHQIFRLGDIVNRPDLKLLFEQLEDAGYRIGAISPFNAANRLNNAAFFMPDPWTNTPSSGGRVLKNLANAISQAVNDNAHGRLTIKSLVSLIQGFFYYTPINQYSWYFTHLKQRNHVGMKAMILDKLLSDLFISEWKEHTPNFSFLFLNAAAHLQHHYLFNSSAYQGSLKNPEWYCPINIDPILNVYKLYDSILGLLSQLPNAHLILATGLSQKPHPKLIFYWRLKAHEQFLRQIGIQNFAKVNPRMSRDFLIEFSEENAATQAINILTACNIQGVPVFKVDGRGASLFIELIYPHNISDDLELEVGDYTLPNFRKQVSFVALKNGEHSSIGYYLDTAKSNPGFINEFPLTQVHEQLILDSKILASSTIDLY